MGDGLQAFQGVRWCTVVAYRYLAGNVRYDVMFQSLDILPHFGCRIQYIASSHTIGIRIKVVQSVKFW